MGVGLSQNALIPSCVRLSAGCAMSYSNFFVYAFAMRERITFVDRILRSKIANTELAARYQEEKKATEFELGNQMFNPSTYKQNVIKWSDMSDHETGNIRR